MAFASAANSTQRVGQYSPGDIAARPRRFAGGVRKQGESRDEFTGRMDAGYRASAMQATPAPRTRQDNIAAARGDGTFDAKRNAYNAANQSSYMDAQGNTARRLQASSRLLHLLPRHLRPQWHQHPQSLPVLLALLLHALLRPSTGSRKDDSSPTQPFAALPRCRPASMTSRT